MLGLAGVTHVHLLPSFDFATTNEDKSTWQSPSFDALAARFFDAFRDGDVEGLREVLAADVQLVGDAGGKAPALSRAVVGADKVARLLAAIFTSLARVGATLEQCEVNGQPGAILRDREGRVAFTFALDVLGGQIQTIRSVGNPDKLRHLGPVVDAWAFHREFKETRRD